jgi:DNA-binding response OmpR family regulator
LVDLEMRALRILLIEDDQDSGEAMSLLLRNQHVDVDWAPTAKEALSLYELHHDLPIDLILVDLMLPDMDGATLIDRLAEIAPLPPVAIHTAASKSAALEAGRKVGAATVLRKPTDWGKMRELLGQCRAALVAG